MAAVSAAVHRDNHREEVVRSSPAQRGAEGYREVPQQQDPLGSQVTPSGWATPLWCGAPKQIHPYGKPEMLTWACVVPTRYSCKQQSSDEDTGLMERLELNCLLGLSLSLLKYSLFFFLNRSSNPQILQITVLSSKRVSCSYTDPHGDTKRDTYLNKY